MLPAETPHRTRPVKKNRRFTTLVLLKKYRLGLLFLIVGAGAFSLFGEEYKRLFGQFVSIVSWGAVALYSFGSLHCTPYKAKCGLKQVFIKNDWRAVKRAFANRFFLNMLLISASTTFIFLGNVAQLMADQVGDKPVLFHFGNPILCAFLWRYINEKRSVL